MQSLSIFNPNYLSFLKLNIVAFGMHIIAHKCLKTDMDHACTSENLNNNA